MGTWFVDKPSSRDGSAEVVAMPRETICFRVVTRGMYPDLVKKTMNMNLAVIKLYEGLSYTYEIVTDNKISIDSIEKCYEVIVPPYYETRTGAKFKARALQYAMEQNVSQLRDQDWVIHLDEETLLTKSSMNGILKFAFKNQHPIGQGN